MTRSPQWRILVDALRANPKGLTIRQLHIDYYLQNTPDAAMQARRKGYKITTEYLDKSNPKIATYVLQERKVVDLRTGWGETKSTTVAVPNSGKLRLVVGTKGEVPNINLLPEKGMVWNVTLEEFEVEVTRDKSGKLKEVHHQPMFPDQPTKGSRAYE